MEYMNQSSKARTSKGNVPFSWENLPGVSKVTYTDEENSMVKLRPPPCPVESGRISAQDIIQVPLPPCTFQAPMPLRSSSRRGLRKDVDDPFLAAYKECTKGKGKDKPFIKDFGSVLKKGIVFTFSCKRTCSVRDDSLVRVSQVPEL